MTNDKQKNRQYIYILYDELGRIKCGTTNDFTRRISQIAHATGLRIAKSYSELSNNAPYVERKLLEYFSNYRMNGTEWLVAGLSFFDVVNVAKELVKETQDEEVDST